MPRKKKWDINQLNDAVHKSTSIRQVLQHLGLRAAGGNYIVIKQYINKHALDTSHFLGKGWNLKAINLKKHIIPLEDILVSPSYYQSYKLKNRLFRAGIKTPICEQCGWSKTASDGRIPLELHHRNGNRHDNQLENLQILCPNCHSLEDNYRAKNKHIY